jgi:hypothetical protein
MKMDLVISIDTDKADMGVSDLIEAHRDLFEASTGRDQIAELMMGIQGYKTNITRQMVERWFDRKRRSIPSGVHLVTFLAACSMIKAEMKQIKQQIQKTMKAVTA